MSAVALRADHSVKTLEGKTAIEYSSENAEVVGRRPDVVVLRVAGGDRLGTEVIGIDEVRMLRD